MEINNAVIEQLYAPIKEFVSRLNENISALPDNPKIQRLNSTCFIMMKSQLRNDWTPEHYDFKFQYREIIKATEKDELKAIEKLGKILNQGYIEKYYERWSGSGFSKFYKITLHPEVIKHVTGLMIELNLVKQL